MQVYEAIVKGLECVGVRAAFGGAGENAAGLMLALKHSKRIKPVITRHEQAAAFMACGYAMYTHKLGFCFATAGPGAFNLFSGLAVAMSDSYPVLAVSGFSTRKFTGKGSLNETSGVNGTPDSNAMFKATTKRSYFIESPADTCDVLEDAVRVAFEGRPGPVHIHVPEDITDPEIQVPNYRDISLDVKPVLPDPGDVKRAAGALLQALRERKRVVLLVGYGAIRSRAGEVLRRFAERFQIPVLTTMDGKGILPADHPLAIGVFADSGHKSAWNAFVDAQVVVAVGNSFAEHATFGFRDDLFAGKSLLHINIAKHEIDKVYRAQWSIVADAGRALNALLEAMSGDPIRPEPSRVAKHDPSRDHIHELDDKIHPAKLVRAMSNLLPDNALVLADAGAHAAWLGYHLSLAEGQQFRKPGSFGPMAGAVNGALGLKVACPDRPVIVGCGDGCYLLSGFELLTAVQYDIPVIWVIFNDNEFKLIKLYQLTAFREAGLVEFENPDYVAYARACGALGYRVETVDEFERAFSDALASGKPAVIDAAITRLAIPHYSTSPEGVLAGLLEALEERRKS